jgi:FlaA1/EpsC-like NDP-sugar epimerase
MPLEKISNWFQKVRNRHFMAMDILICIVVPVLSLFLRYEGDIDWHYIELPLAFTILIFTVSKMSLFYYFGFYKRLWSMASIDELAIIMFAGLWALILETFIFIVFHRIDVFTLSRLPYSLPFLDSFFSMFFVALMRFSIRFVERISQRVKGKNQKKGERILIAGAGAAGTEIVQEMQRSAYLGLHPIAFVDDDPSKHNLRHRGVPIAGSCSNIREIIGQYKIEKVIIALPTAPGSKIRQIVSDCLEAGVETLTVPGIFEILNGRVNIEKIRKIQIEDLLRREPVKTDIEKVKELIQNKSILITGAGGSIGSELCRQLLKFNPSRLILLGHGENSIFEIEQELKVRKKEKIQSGSITTKITARIADLRFKDRLKDIFEEFNPEIVFHSAAHKHVPLMESNPQEAVTNNILGTKNLVDTAIEFNVSHFISISTDKAVNPTNIMGASKRVTEMIVMEAAAKTGRIYSAVRFGNVLGSSGSVVRTFQKQLENGGPLTITHPDIIRYFMTIPEAVQLVLQASVLGKGGEIFVLDMGQPIKIEDLAKDMIRLAGYMEGTDINIKVIGLRPGEKLFEELFVKGETYEKTIHEKILIARNASLFISEYLSGVLDHFIESKGILTREEIIARLFQLVPEFQPDEIRNDDKILSNSRL